MSTAAQTRREVGGEQRTVAGGRRGEPTPPSMDADVVASRPMPHNIVHFAIHADDVERARRFYEAVFGWHFERWGPPDFYEVTTGHDDRPGIRGALHGRDQALTGTGNRGFTCTVAVDDLAAIREKVIGNGGTITHQEVEVPTVGALTQFLDTEGNELAAMVYEVEMFGA